MSTTANRTKLQHLLLIRAKLEEHIGIAETCLIMADNSQQQYFRSKELRHLREKQERIEAEIDHLKLNGATV